MKRPKNKLDGLHGFSFGTIDAVINMLGITMGLSVIENKTALIIGLLAGGIANSFGNAAGFHVSEEAEGIHTKREVWESTFMAGIGTFFPSLILLVPLLLTDLATAVPIIAVLGIFLVVIISVVIGKRLKYKSREIFDLSVEYVSVCLAVILVTLLVGRFISSAFLI